MYRKYTLALKIFLVRKYLRGLQHPSTEALSIRDLAKRYDVPKSTLHNWITTYRKNKYDKNALIDHRRGPKPERRKQKKVTTQIIQIITEYHQKFNFGCWILSDITKARLGNAGVSHTTVWKIMKQLGLGSKRPRTRYKRFRADSPDDLWQIDLFGPVKFASATLYGISVIDDYSRYAWVKLTAHPPTTHDVISFLSEIIESTKRSPFAILTDNGSVFGREFDKWCRLMKRRDAERRVVLANYLQRDSSTVGSWWLTLRYSGVMHLHGRVKHPQTQGKVERFIGEVKKIMKACTTAKDVVERFEEGIMILNRYRIVREYGLTPEQMYNDIRIIS